MKRVYIKPDIEVIELASENALHGSIDPTPEEVAENGVSDEWEPGIKGL